MREILFKAKRVDNGEWIEGGFCQSSNGRTFLAGVSKYGYIDGLEVVPETICQYTGFNDYHDNKIWENDLIECKEFSNGYLIKHFLSQVEWDDTGTGFAFKDSKHGWAFMDSLAVYECEVIGNVFDNPKLMKGSEENG